MSFGVVMKKWIVSCVILIVGIAVFIGLKSQKKEVKVRKTRVVVQTLTASPLTLTPEKIEIRGRSVLQGLDEVKLVAEVSGKIFSKSFNLREGQSFRKGQILAQVDNFKQLASWENSLQGMRSAVANLIPEIKRDIPERSRAYEAFLSELLKLKTGKLPAFPSQNEISEKEILYLGRFQIQSLWANLKLQKKWMSKHIVYAPFSGVVIQSFTSPGNFAGPGVALAKIIRNDYLEAKVSLSRNYAQFIKKGDRVELKNNLEKTVFAKVNNVGSFLESGSFQQKVIVRFKASQSSNWVPGEWVEAKFEIDSEKIKSPNDTRNLYKIPLTSLNEKQILIAHQVESTSAKVLLTPVQAELILKENSWAWVVSEAAIGDTLITENMLSRVNNQKYELNLGVK
jgi:membrane fusion protein, multidrug efflux system